MTAELDLLTMNLWGLPWPVARGRRERKRRFVEHFLSRAYDLVAIQELWWPWRRVPSVRLPRSRRDSGLALAGRLHVHEELRVDPFRDHAGVDRLKRKGMLRANVETRPGAAMSVCVTHLQAGRRHARVRARQVDQLLDGLATERRPVVVMGDFNLYGDVDEDLRSVERLHAAGLVDAALALERDEPTYPSSSPCARSRRRAQRFDRVYLRDGDGFGFETLGVEVIRLRPRPVSDHHPVRVRVRLSG